MTGRGGRRGCRRSGNEEARSLAPKIRGGEKGSSRNADLSIHPPLGGGSSRPFITIHQFSPSLFLVKHTHTRVVEEEEEEEAASKKVKNDDDDDDEKKAHHSRYTRDLDSREREKFSDGQRWSARRSVL